MAPAPAPTPNSAHLAALADRFAIKGLASSVEPLGHGNVNDTFRVETSSGACYVLQRLNTAVFTSPELVMANLERLSRHCQARGNHGGCQLPQPLPLRSGEGTLLRESDGSAWRLLSFIADACSVDVLESCAQAEQIGRGLGRFHALVHDLPGDQLHDTLEGFHVTPRYLAHYRQELARAQATGTPARCPESEHCQRFVEQRLTLVPVLEEALAAGRLQLRPIHGDPKVNNVLLCQRTGQAVAVVDLDTVKPGLLHTDIGDCLRSACNPAGEETTNLEAVHFDLNLAEALLRGYLAEARSYLSQADRDHLYDAIRLLPFELGLRFFTDHLAGNVYFKTSHPRQNLDRALVQFRLTESIEAQEDEIRQLIARLSWS
jgi:Ser/Thr protein kinase RdoA (MazF antagonist)